MFKLKCYLVLICLFVCCLHGSYLTQVHGNLYDSSGNEIRLTGVNWFGFETSMKIPHGLWTRDYQSMLNQIRDLGFNCIRLPWSNDIISCTEIVSVNTFGPDPYTGDTPINTSLVDCTPLEAMDEIVNYAGELGLKIILDNHSRVSDGYMGEELWYTSTFSEEQWIEDWEYLALRYIDNSTVVAFDINNEPHGVATWGNGDISTDWKIAAERCANAILAINPDVLIIIEGVEHFDGEHYWWGGNLEGAFEYPINIDIMEKLVYSTHEYGPEVHLQPWFEDISFPENMSDIWEEHFGFLMSSNLNHVFVGEFGIRDETSHDGAEGIWFSSFLDYIASDYSWTFWCMNPNSGDTGGILQDDWYSVNTWKMDYLTPHLSPLIDDAGLEVYHSTINRPILNVNTYPNPFNSVCNIEKPNNLTAEILDIEGNLVEIIQPNESCWKPKEDIPAGKYLIHVDDEDVSYRQSVIYVK